MATLSLKLLIDNNSNKVVFAEAGKEFVDFLFGYLQVPLGSTMGLLSEHDVVRLGSWSRVYESIENLDPSFLQSKASKDSLLRPYPTFSSNTHTPQLLLDFVPPTPSTPSFLFGDPPASPFGGFGQPNAPSTDKKETGYVRDVVTYMVMDDLTVKPMSTISGVTLLTNLYVKDVSSLREKMVELDKKKGLELITASFDSTTVLTDIFIGSKRSQSFLDIWDPVDGFVNSSIAYAPAIAIETYANLPNLRIDWKETPEAHVFKADLPGLVKEEVKVEVEEGQILQISGERSKEQEEKKDKWYRVERSSGKFLRRFRLPKNARTDQVKASMENGVLTVFVPTEGVVKKPEVKTIEISG
ncbi:hypothetical protein SO802_018201 [Lithocarpus litseifolius]|uniref:SHSP domain-containing protein n=1 Tax=Lithocarpus litseifolius TaxID=425828 RepID=A0AAW2CM68_9ROSI